MKVLRTMYSFRISFWIVPSNRSQTITPAAKDPETSDMATSCKMFKFRPCTCEQTLINALLFSRNDERGQNGQHSAIHRHGHGHLVQRNGVEQNFHVLHRIDRHARLKAKMQHRT